MKENFKLREYQLNDNSMFVLHICKFFEGVLRLIANESGWFMKFNTRAGTSIRGFFLNHRTKIEAELKFPGLVLDVVIPKNTTLGLAAFEKKPVALFDITASGAEAYLALAQNIIRSDRKQNK